MSKKDEQNEENVSYRVMSDTIYSLFPKLPRAKLSELMKYLEVNGLNEQFLNLSKNPELSYEKGKISPDLEGKLRKLRRIGLTGYEPDTSLLKGDTNIQRYFWVFTPEKFNLDYIKNVGYEYVNPIEQMFTENLNEGYLDPAFGMRMSMIKSRCMSLGDMTDTQLEQLENLIISLASIAYEGFMERGEDLLVIKNPDDLESENIDIIPVHPEDMIPLFNSYIEKMGLELEISKGYDATGEVTMIDHSKRLEMRRKLKESQGVPPRRSMRQRVKIKPVPAH